MLFLESYNFSYMRFSYVPGLKASNEETYRKYAINNIGVLNYIYNCKKY